MPRKANTITVDLLPIDAIRGEQPCPWIRATEVLVRAAERLGLPLAGDKATLGSNATFVYTEFRQPKVGERNA